MNFKLSSSFSPSGDQPKAIKQLVVGLKSGLSKQTLLGVTGSGKTFTMAGVIEQIQKPTLVIAHNKTLAAQLTTEFRSFFPEAAVEYFVSYYDYYQPEAYLPTTDTYIEKEAMINEEIDRLRHAATQALLSRPDTIIVASVSCIYGLGSPSEYLETVMHLEEGQKRSREKIIRELVSMYFTRVAGDLKRGTFRAKGETIEIMPADKEIIYRIELKGDKIQSLKTLHPVTRHLITDNRQQKTDLWLFPAKHYVVPPATLEEALQNIEKELGQRLKFFEKEGKFLEMERLERRTRYDLELIREIGYCNGIENYSRHLEGRAPGEPPSTLLNYFFTPRSPEQSRRGEVGPPNFLLFIDESHQTIPQLGGMYEGDRSRKEVLVEHGFRLPSALDNRPLKFDEFERMMPHSAKASRGGAGTIFVSATPASYELKHSKKIVEQIVRPTGLVDPAVSVCPTEGQIDDLLKEIERQAKVGERTLVTTLTKKMAEDLTDFLAERGIQIRYLHSDIETLPRIEILRDLRKGEFDVLVGVNLLREGLDLPEVSLVAILDADKEGFLRSETSLIQTIGRAARNVNGRVVLYAEAVTQSMKRAIRETDRRRQIQLEYNRRHGITPRTIQKEIKSIIEDIEAKKLDEIEKTIAEKDLPSLIKQKEKEMKQAAQDLRFEEAAMLRDELIRLRKLKTRG